MGTWGPKLYQDDIAEGVRDYYKDKLHRGKNGNEITRELIEQNQDIIFDSDDAPVFWFALADTQWNFGRLEDDVKRQALHYIENGSGLKRWEEEKNYKDLKIRHKVISELKQKLLSPQPQEKKIAQYKLYRCKWNTGDVYAYQFCGDYAQKSGFNNKYIFFVKVDEAVWHPGHIIPVVYCYNLLEDRLLSIQDLKNTEYLPQFFNPEVYIKNPSKKILYLLALLSTSSRVIPENQLTFIGNIQNVERINKEDINPYQVYWKDFERYIIDNFLKWNAI